MVRELGDFQTPLPLVEQVLECLGPIGKQWPRVLEPTCGKGNFIGGLLKCAYPPLEIRAFELQDEHLCLAKNASKDHSSTKVTIQKANIFDLDFRQLRWKASGPLLVVGNPPWVTNSALGALGSDNVPTKTNLKGLRGLDALTGESNFDIAEHIWLKLIIELAHEKPTIALLCKTSVARNVLQFLANTSIKVEDASIRRLDANRWFGAMVDACLFSIHLGGDKREYTAKVYPDLESRIVETTVAIINGKLIVDKEDYDEVSFADGVSPVTWRQGIKHDAAPVMELRRVPGGLGNQFGETVDIEPEHLYPLLKSSDLFNGRSLEPRFAVIVSQKHLGEDTRRLKNSAPKLWGYLQSHRAVFDNRKSSIYEGKSPFAMFGIGDYSFAPYKVAISGLYKAPRFSVVGPQGFRPVMFDDTCYFIPCYSPHQAALLAAILNGPMCQRLMRSLVFWDAKRPITKKLLQRIDLRELLDHEPKSLLLKRADQEFDRIGMSGEDAHQWPSSLSELLIGYEQGQECQLQLTGAS